MRVLNIPGRKREIKKENSRGGNTPPSHRAECDQRDKKVCPRMYIFVYRYMYMYSAPLTNGWMHVVDHHPHF